MAPTSLVHWVHEGRWDVWPLSKIPNELRFEGALGMIKYSNGKSYLGRIVKISGNPKEIEAAEVKLHAEILKKQGDVPSKRTTKRVQKSGKLATNKEVSRALGERSVLSTPQREVKKKASEENKSKAAAQKLAEEQEQQGLLKSVSRNLFSLGNSSMSSNKPATSTPAFRDSLSDDDAVDNSDDEPHDIDDTGDVESTNGIADNADIPIGTDTPFHITGDDVNGDESDRASEDGGDREIKDFKNPNTESFLKYLLMCFGSTSLESSPSNKVYAKPLEVPDQKMVHLKKGHSLRINKGGRNVLVLDKNCQKSATNFIRKTLVQIYGKEQLAQMTVMGRKKNSLSISPADMSAIYEFISEYTSPITWNEFVREVTKKLSATKSSPKVNSKSNKRWKGSSPTGADKTPNKDKTPTKDKTPVKEKTPIKEKTPAKEKSPTKIFASPLKFQEKMVVQPLPVASPQKSKETSTAGDSTFQSQPSSSWVDARQWNGYWGQQRQHNIPYTQEQMSSQYEQQPSSQLQQHSSFPQYSQFYDYNQPQQPQQYDWFPNIGKSSGGYGQWQSTPPQQNTVSEASHLHEL